MNKVLMKDPLESPVTTVSASNLMCPAYRVMPSSTGSGPSWTHPTRWVSQVPRSCRGVWVPVLLVSLVVATQLRAQQPASGRRAQATRQELEATLAAMPVAQQNGTEALLIRDRLAHGDFKVGDRVSLYIEGEAKPVDTLTVTPTQTIVIPGLTEVNLQGVLRSELEDQVVAQLQKYLRNPVVRAQALIRIGLIGEIRNPGYYSFPAETPLNDTFTAAGGLGAASDLTKSTVKRGDKIIWHPEDLQPQLAAGATLDQMDLQSGDVLDVGHHGSGATSALQVASLLIGVTLGILTIVAVVGK